VQVDFYQLGASALEQVVGSIAEKVLTSDGRLLIVAEDEPLLARLDRMLWDLGATSFLPHALAGGADDARQPRNMLIADGQWRDSALTYDRSFFLFDASTLEGARLAWKLLAGRDGVERRYWAQVDGRWTQQA